MAVNPATAASAVAFEDYYFGLRGNPTLLARSSTSPWTLPWDQESLLTTYPKRDPKAIFALSHDHPLRSALDEGLRQTIRDVLMGMDPPKWISVDYIRLGYDKIDEKKNPVVAFVTVEENQISIVEAQRVVTALALECHK